MPWAERRQRGGIIHGGLPLGGYFFLDFTRHDYAHDEKGKINHYHDGFYDYEDASITGSVDEIGGARIFFQRKNWGKAFIYCHGAIIKFPDTPGFDVPT
jgi:hypothetical protein